MPGERVQIDEETWHALEVLRRDKMTTFQELDQAISNFLQKNHRPVTLRQALKESASKTGEPKRRQRRGRRFVMPMSHSHHNKTLEEYRQLAEKCREKARTVSAENERVELLARAHSWDLIAEARRARRRANSPATHSAV